jgi:hypothetical protein
VHAALHAHQEVFPLTAFLVWYVQNHYEELGVAVFTATTKEIKLAYRAGALKYHPDKVRVSPLVDAVCFLRCVVCEWCLSAQARALCPRHSPVLFPVFFLVSLRGPGKSVREQ